MKYQVVLGRGSIRQHTCASCTMMMYTKRYDASCTFTYKCMYSYVYDDATWESVTNSDWLMYDTSGASVMGSSAVKLQTHKNYPFTRATHETDWITTDGQSTYKGVGSG